MDECSYYRHLVESSTMKNKFCIVTGSNTGIGFQTARTLAKLGATVILACRDERRGQEAMNIINLELKENNLSGKAVFVPLNLGDLQSVVTFVNKIQELTTSVDILVNNAGLSNSGVTQDNLQQLFQVNYLGHSLLYRLLEPLLSAVPDSSSQFSSSSSSSASPSRVVNLSSVMHHLGQSDFISSSLTGISPQDYPSLLNRSFHLQPLGQGNCYADSKMYMNLLTLEINKRERQRQIQSLHSLSSSSSSSSSSTTSSSSSSCARLRPILSLSVNPGAVRSDIWRHVPFPLSSLYDLFMRVFYLDTQQGSFSSLFACLVPVQDVPGVSNILPSSSPSTSSSTSSSSSLPECELTQTKGGEMTGHPLIPYLIPYSSPRYSSLSYSESQFNHQKRSSLSFLPYCLLSLLDGLTSLYSHSLLPSSPSFHLSWEAINFSSTPRWGSLSFPLNGDEISRQLWEYSEKLCEEKVRVNHPDFTLQYTPPNSTPPLPPTLPYQSQERVEELEDCSTPPSKSNTPTPNPLPTSTPLPTCPPPSISFPSSSTTSFHIELINENEQQQQEEEEEEEVEEDKGEREEEANLL